MNIRIFYHIGMLGNWESLVDRQMKRVKAAGLYDASTINIGFATDNYRDDSSQLSNILQNNNMTENINILSCSGHKLSTCEYHTIKSLKSFADSDNSNANIFYFHTKGLSHANLTSDLFVKDWVELLEYFCIDKWKNAVKALEFHDAYGVNYLLKSSWHETHFSGNFWWARSNYIKTLDINKLNLHDRLSAEMWIVANNHHKAACPHSSHIDHYSTPYPKNLYQK